LLELASADLTDERPRCWTAACVAPKSLRSCGRGALRCVVTAARNERRQAPLNFRPLHGVEHHHGEAHRLPAPSAPGDRVQKAKLHRQRDPEDLAVLPKAASVQRRLWNKSVREALRPDLKVVLGSIAR